MRLTRSTLIATLGMVALAVAPGRAPGHPGAAPAQTLGWLTVLHHAAPRRQPKAAAPSVRSHDVSRRRPLAAAPASASPPTPTAITTAAGTAMTTATAGGTTPAVGTASPASSPATSSPATVAVTAPPSVGASSLTPAGGSAEVTAAAATLYVALNGSDQQDCLTPATACRTIGQALALAEAGATINLAAGAYTETVTIPLSVTLLGAGAGQSILDGTHRGTVVTVNVGATVAISGVTIQHGSAATGAASGGGIYNEGTLTLTNSAVLTNTAGFGSGISNNGYGSTMTVIDSTLSGNTAHYSGGGLYNAGTVTVIDSTLNGNSADSGGGIYNSGYGHTATMTVIDSTLSGNSATSNGGGGIRNAGGTVTVIDSTLNGNSTSGAGDYDYGGGGIYNSGFDNSATMTVTNSTLSGNTASPGLGGGIINAPDPYGNGATILTLSYDTIAANSDGIERVPGANTIILTGTVVANSTTGANCMGHITEGQGFNLDSGTSCGFSHTTDLTATNPLLGPLQNNGGPTLTMALLPGSPASDHGGTAATGCPATDQRGQPRPDEASDNGVCDIGAVEGPAGAPTVSLSRPSGRYTDPLTHSGAGFGPSETINVYWDSTATGALSSTTSTGSGTFTATLSVPQAISGTHALIALGQRSGLRASVPFSILPGAYLLHYQGYKGTQDVLKGAGFAPYEVVTGYWNNPSGTPFTVTATTNGVGTFGGSTTYPGITFTVPLSPAGAYRVYAVGQSSGGIAGSTFTLKPHVQVTPSSGRAGTPVTVGGTGYGARETVTITYNCGTAGCSSTTVLAMPQADANGSFSVVVTIPSSTSVGAHAIGAKGTTSGVFATTTFRVTP